MKTRRVVVITLRISIGHGVQYLISLNMGRLIQCYQWQELTITDAVIYIIEEMATLEEAPETIDV